MEEKDIVRTEDFHSHIQDYGRTSVIYRGVSDQTYDLVPKIGRLGIPKAELEKAEKMLLSRFKRQAIQYLNYTPEDDWDWLSVAQHHGLPTRLLDWSHNPLVALFFAVNTQYYAPGAVYCYRLNWFVDVSTEPSPFKLGKLMKKYFPKHLSKRITAQAGVFTVHRKPSVPIDSKRIVKLNIPSDIKNDFMSMLFRYGINHSTLFPDLDGVSRNLEWIMKDKKWPDK